MATFPAAFKKGKNKVPGVLLVDTASCILKWDTQPGSGADPFEIKLANVKGLFATPATNPSSLLKVSCENPEKDFTFAFKERALLEDAKSQLQKAIQSARNTPAASSVPPETPAQVNGSSNGDQNNSNNTANNTKSISLDSKKLLENYKLQEQLLKENKDLMKTFKETVIQGGLPIEAFWASRVHLLRTHALLMSQKRGAYNVLGTIKPTATSDNQINLSLTREKIHDIFEQYPIVRQAYNESVPMISESKFWERFFMSRLFRRLRGEKVSATEALDPIMDKYLGPDGNVLRSKEEDDDEDEEDDEAGDDGPGTTKENAMDIDSKGKSSTEKGKLAKGFHLPQYLDVEGNEEDLASSSLIPDFTMQPGKSGKDVVSLIQSMNNLSERMLHVKPSSSKNFQDVDESHLVDQLRFSDLQGPSKSDNYIDLKLLNDQVNLYQDKNNSNDNATDDMDVDVPPEKLEYIQRVLKKKLDLRKVGIHTEEIQLAEKQISTTTQHRAREVADISNWQYQWALDPHNKLLGQVTMCHATSIEFLRQFWTNFHSGDPAKASTLAKVVQSLQKCFERIDAVTAASDTEKLKEQVRHSLAPLRESISIALTKYNDAVAQDGA